MQHDRAGFIRTPKVGWDLGGALIEIDVSIESTLIAVRAVSPDFDPQIGEA